MNFRLFTLLLFYVINTQLHAQILEHKTNIEVTDDKVYTHKYYKTQVNSSQERDRGDIYIRHSDDSSFKILTAQIVNKNGKVVRKLKKKNFITTNVPSYQTFYTDGLITNFELFWDDYPYTIEYSYKEVEKDFLYITQFHPEIISTTETKHAELNITLPSNYQVNIDADKAYTFSESVSPKGKRVLSWSIKNYQPLEREYFSPSKGNLIPMVKVVPQTFNYGVNGSHKSWKECAKWCGELNSKTNDLPDSEKNIVNNLIKTASTDEEKIKILYNYLQDNTNYVNVSIDLGGFKSYPASYVCEKKYGDCKALTSYMKALLEQAGIQSFYTLVYAGQNIVKVNSDFPSQQFNHIFLTIPMQKDTLYLENTSKHIPYNHMSSSIQNRHVLFIDGEQSKLIKTPKVTPEENLEKRSYEFILDSKGNGVVTMKSLHKGSTFEKYLSIKNIESDDNKEKVVSNLIGLKNSELVSYNFNQKDRDTNEIEIIGKANVSKSIKKIGSIHVIQPPKISLSKIETPSKRSLPFVFSLPYYNKDSYAYTVENVTKDQYKLPDPIEISSRFGLYTYYVEKTGKGFCAHRVFKIFSGEYSLKDYEEFYKFYNQIKDAQDKTSIIY